MLIWRDIRVRYKQSVMGFFWAILMPLLIVSSGILVRIATATYSGGSVTKADLGSVMIRAVAWAFFIAGIRFATNSLIGNPNLVTKIAFPKEVFPISAVLANLIDFSISLPLVLVVGFVLGLPITPHILWILPLTLLLIALTLGLGLILSAANLFFRDVKYLVEVVLTYAIFFTPVLYDAKALGKWQGLILFNPVAPILEALAATVAEGHEPDFRWLTYSALASLVILLAGYSLFKQLEARFAESL